MSHLPTFVTLNNGFKIPAVGFGTFDASADLIENSISCAIDAGYRHIDCAHFYKNQTAVGKALNKKINEGLVKREELFITSKLWNDAHDPDDVRKQFDVTLKDLGLDFIDLYLVHWPTAFQHTPGRPFTLDDPSCVQLQNIPLEETWKAMESLVDAGLVKSIGVSNFNKSQIDRILKCCKIKPVVNQVEVSVDFLNEKLIKYCQSIGIQIEAYAPFGSPAVIKNFPSLLDEEFVKEIAAAHQKSPAQVLCRHGLQRGLVVLMKSVTPSRIRSNFKVFDFQLTEEEMNVLNNSGRKLRHFRIPTIESHPEYPFHDEF